MNNQDILTDATDWNKADWNTNGLNLVNGCVPENTNFTFTGATYDDFATDFADWVKKNSKAERTGDHQDVQLAENAEIRSKGGYKIVAKQVNVQSAHDLVKLKSSGGVLTAEKAAHGILKQAVIVSVVSTIANEILITLITLDISIGTMVFWTDLTAGTPQEKDFFAQKKNIVLDGLISGHQYEIIVAHKGVVRKIITSNPVKVWVS